MRIDRNAAAIVAHRDAVVGGELELDAARMAGHRLVHRIVHDLGDEVMEGALVGAADIHARPAAHRLQPLEDLDVLGGVAGGLFAGEVVEKIGRHDGPHYRKRGSTEASWIRYGIRKMCTIYG